MWTRLTEVGPVIGVELRNKALIALALVLLCILLFIAFAFRKVSQPISSWIYGFIALVTLVHDVIIPVGFFALLGFLTGAHVDTLFVTAILTVLGFSIHDTIVVFDRVRENLRVNTEHNRKEDFADVAGRSARADLRTLHQHLAHRTLHAPRPLSSGPRLDARLRAHASRRHHRRHLLVDILGDASACHGGEMERKTEVKTACLLQAGKK